MVINICDCPKRIWLLKKRAVRVMTNSPYRAHSAPLFLQLRVFDIFKVNTFHIVRFMFLYHDLMLPAILLNLFVTNNQIHSHNTRNANFIDLILVVPT